MSSSTCIGAHRDYLSRLLVNLAPVSNPGHIDDFGRVVNDINYPIVANTNPPFVVAALKFLAAWRSGHRRQLFEARNHPGDHFVRQPVQFFFRTRG